MEKNIIFGSAVIWNMKIRGVIFVKCLLINNRKGIMAENKSTDFSGWEFAATGWEPTGVGHENPTEILCLVFIQ